MPAAAGRRAHAIPAQERRRTLKHALPLALLAAAIGAYYAPQLAIGGVQYDAVDVHYAAQRYLSDELRAGRLPFWTPYIFGGFPFVADLQVGAWYPLNWPFLALGITPRSLSMELLLHSAVACLGAYCLAWRLLGSRVASVIGAVFYGLSGYFAAHAQHVGMSQAAAWLPWIVLLLLTAMDRSSTRLFAVAGVLGAMLALPGSFQIALYAFCGVAVWALLDAGSAPRARRVLGALVAVGIGGALLAAVMILPGAELVSQSIRTELDPRSVGIGYFHPDSLATLVWPDYYGLLSGSYHGPGDSTQHYFYAGLLLLPLALLGLRHGRVVRIAALLGLPFLWYALGPIGGLFRLVVRLPGFASVELPMHGWFLPGLGLALLGAAGMARLNRPRLGALFITATLVDVVINNQLRNPLAYARQSFDALYGTALASFAAQATGAQRVYGPPASAVGYRNHALQSRIETTYGYNPLELRAYAEYADAAELDPSLVTGFAASHELRPDGSVVPVADPPPLVQLANGRATVLYRDLDRLSIAYAADAPGIVRVAIAAYPGWHASLNGAELPLETVDGAFIGIRAPPGEGSIQLRYTPRYFAAGATISVVALIVCAVALLTGGNLRTSAWGFSHGSRSRG